MHNRDEKSEVADVITRFMSGKIGPHEWDDFISIPLDDPYLEAIRLRCRDLPDDFPPQKRGEYCSSEGDVVLRQILGELTAT